MAAFNHLHVHTAYSLLDGAIKIPDLLAQAKEFGMDSVAVTDHGNMFGIFTFYEKALEAGIKPILGCEVYVAPLGRKRRNQADPRYHLVLLAKNYQGYKNMIRLVTMANLEGFYYKPRVDLEILSEYNEGLIALSACLSGQVPGLILDGREEEAAKAAETYAGIFKDRFYLELQQNYIDRQERVNQGLISLASKMGLPLVATNDCHYLRRSDAEAHDVLLCIQTGKTVEDENRLRFENDEFYFKSPEEMSALFPEVPEAIDNTLKISAECDVEIPTGTYHFPIFPLEEGEDQDSRLMAEARAGLERRLEHIQKTRKLSAEERQEYVDRLEVELDVITRMQFSGYFLVVCDFIKYARDHDIPVGPGRGSAAGSLAAYSLSITDIDPLPYGLIFERFLNVERISMPDFDIDFCKNGREEVINYVSRRYGGRENVAQIITFGQMQARAVIRDVGRGLGMPYGDVDRIAKLIPNKLNITLKEALKMEPRIEAAVEQDQRVEKLLRIAQLLEGLPRHASTHAAGLVIGDKPLVEYLPLYSVASSHTDEPEKVVVTQYDMHGVEKIGLIKFDFLGLKTLTLIDYTLKLLKKNGVTLDMSSLDLEDRLTYDLLCAGDTTGVFQLEGSGVRDLVVKAQPSTFNDLIVLVALYRPGPLESGLVDNFVNSKQGHGKINYELDELIPILKDTYGVIIYQEQVMEIASRLANYSLGEADYLRKAMGKKIPEVMAEQRERFMQGVEENKLDAKKASKIFDQMAKFAGYGFNKAHTTAYALIAYQTAFLKANHRLEFMAALLNNEVSNTDKIVRLINECREKDVTVLPPDINQSEVDFTVEDGKIRFGLAAIKGLGLAAIESIVEARADGPFTDLFDLCQRVDLRRVNRKVIEAVIKSGALDSPDVHRSQMAAVMDEAMETGARAQRDRETGQTSLFESLDDQDEVRVHWPAVPEWRETLRLSYEKEALGFYLSGHPLARYADDMASLNT
ncbi:MAG: DNA polymerase III subunit alpha, partial [Deltaproteobacteria bacterium]|nr:DNA polymerase III subunit alpha [Deltaproteobacteria bacterium]